MLRWFGPIVVFLTVFVCISICQGDTAEKSFKLLIIDSQKGKPYKTVRENVINYLKRSGLYQGNRLFVTYHSIGNFPGTLKNILSIERHKNFDAVLLNGTMALIGAKKYAMGDSHYKFIFGAVTDPIGIGVIDAFNVPPKANFTGVAYPVDVSERLRFIKKWLPKAKRVGLIYADMPQSHSYNNWLLTALKQEEFKNLKLVTRQVPFIPSEGGHIRMAMLAEKHIKDLNSLVDVFISPNDQMGVQRPFVEVMARSAEKPLVGLSKTCVTEGWGATLSIYPSMENSAEIAGQMIIDLFEGRALSTLHPVYPRYGIAFDKKLAHRFGIILPQPSTPGHPTATLVFE